jgi:hypothetical protein
LEGHGGLIAIQELRGRYNHLRMVVLRDDVAFWLPYAHLDHTKVEARVNEGQRRTRTVLLFLFRAKPELDVVSSTRP